MKSFAKILLVTTIAVVGISLSAVSSEAAKKKAKAPAACTPLTSCYTKDGIRQTCGVNGVWAPVLLPACKDCGPKC